MLTRCGVGSSEDRFADFGPNATSVTHALPETGEFVTVTEVVLTRESLSQYLPANKYREFTRSASSCGIGAG